MKVKQNGTLNNTNMKIRKYCKELSDFLIEKNNKYGDSLQNPNNIFQKDKLNGIKARIDDKINRIKTVGINNDTEDTVTDLIGYLIHLKIMIREKKKEKI